MIAVLRSSKSTESPTQWAAGNCSQSHKAKPKQKGNRDVDQLSHVDHVTINANSCHGESQLYIFEDIEAVIKNDLQRQNSNEWDTCQEPTELRLIGHVVESNHICSHQKPTRGHVDQR